MPANQGKPGDICSINKSFHCRVSRQKVTSTLRQFLQGNDLEDVDWNGMGLLSLLKFDAKFDYYLRKSPSDLPFQWILDNVLPVTTSHLHSDVWWDMCITKVLCMTRDMWNRPSNQALAMLTHQYSIQAERLGFIHFVSNCQMERQFDEHTQSHSNHFVERCGGVSFLHIVWGKCYSPISMAMHSAFFHGFSSPPQQFRLRGY